jgi:hypothetical protein
MKLRERIRKRLMTSSQSPALSAGIEGARIALELALDRMRNDIGGCPNDRIVIRALLSELDPADTQGGRE